MKSNDDKNLPLPFKIASAGLAGCTADIFTFPFDTAKVWLMVRGENAAKPLTTQSLHTEPRGGLPFSSTTVFKNMKSHGVANFHVGRPVRMDTTVLSIADSNEMTMSELFVRKRQAMKGKVVPNIVSDTPEAVRLRAQASQTFNELTISEQYIARRNAALSAVKESVKTKTSAIHTIITNIKQRGFGSLYGGLNAGLQRQIGFCSVRIGLYDHIKKFYSDQLPATSGGGVILQRILAGATSGCFAVFLFQPTEVVKIRMQAERARYKGSIDAYRRIFKTGGVREMWKGTDANCARLSIVNVCELVTYDVAKDALLKRELMKDGVPCHFVSALIAGLVTTVVANPVDVVKTRYMNSEKGTYKNPLQCAAQLAKNEGLTAFYKGFLPSYVRIGLWNLVMFLSYEQYKLLSKQVAENISQRRSTSP